MSDHECIGLIPINMLVAAYKHINHSKRVCIIDNNYDVIIL